MNGFLYDLAFKPLEMIQLSQLRQDLLSSAAGKILEIGAGTGLNFPHYPAGSEVLATELDEDMMKQAKKRGSDYHIRLEAVNAQELPYPDDEFDTVVATLVFCTIPDPDKALKEVYRVLRPNGSLLLLEHVRRNTPIAGNLLDALTPVWKLVAGGCHLNRDPERSMTKLGFKTVSKEVIWKGLGKVWHLRK